MALILRRDKGSKLSITELDANFEYLDSKSGGGSASTGDITFVGTTMSSNTLDKDIVIETKGEGGVVIQNDKVNSWALNVGLKFNNDGDVWGSSVTVDDEGNSYTTGGDYLINGNPRGFVIKTNKFGEIIWQKHIKEFAYGESIVYKNGHLYFLLTETANSYGMLLIKLDTDGNSIDQWSFEYPEQALMGNNPYGYEIDVDENENVYWVAYIYMSTYNSITSGYNLVTGKLNTVSNTNEWNLLLDSGDYVDFGYSIKYKNNFIYLTGQTRNTNANNIIIITKLDTDGNQIWTKTIDNDPLGSRGESITVDNLDNVYVCGFKDSNVDNSDNFYLKLDSLGNIVWTKKLTNNLSESSALQISNITSIDFNVDGFLYISTIFNGDVIIFKIDTDGNIIWQNIVGTNFDEDTYHNNGHRSIKTTNDSLYVTGYNYNNIVPGERYGTNTSNMFLLKYDLNGLDNNTFQDWTIISSSFSQSDYMFTTSSNISLTTATFSHPITKTHFDLINANFDSQLTNFSNKKTQLKVKGEINVNDLYVLPESTGKTGEVLTYPTSGNTLQWDKPGTLLTVDDFVKSDWMMPTYTTNFDDNSQISTTSSYKRIIGQKEVNILTIYNYYLGGTFSITRRGDTTTDFTWPTTALTLQSYLSMFWMDYNLAVEEIYSDNYDKKFKISSYEYNTNSNSVVNVSYFGGLTASIETIQGYSQDQKFENEYIEIDFRDYPYYPNSGGTEDITFSTGVGFNGDVYTIEVQSDGKSIFGGLFTKYDSVTVPHIVRLNIDGTIDYSFENKVGFDNNVNTLKIQSDGKILVGGSFTNYSGTTASHISRLNTNGSIDKSFNIGTGFDGNVTAIEIQTDGKILVGGNFANYNGTTAGSIIRLNSDGTIDTNFVSGFGFSYMGDSVLTIKVLSTGNILVGGGFDGYNQTSTNCLVEMNSVGTITNAFDGMSNIYFDGTVRTIVEQPDGKILIGGDFSMSPSSYLARLNSDFSIDDRWNDSAPGMSNNPNFNSTVRSIKLQSDGKILCGGEFTQYYDNTYMMGMYYRSCSKLARLNSNGRFDTTFNVGFGFGQTVLSIAVQLDDKILVGGRFTDYNMNSNKNHIIRLYTGSGLEVQYLQPEFMGVRYDKVGVSANSYLTFGGGSSLTHSNTLNLPGIFISSSTNNTMNARGYTHVYAGFYTTSNSENIFKIRYQNKDVGFAWEVCFIINQGNTIDIKIGDNYYIDSSDSGFTAIKDTSFIRKEFLPTTYTNYILPEAWGSRDVKSDSIKLNNPGITYSISENITDVNLPLADSNWTTPNLQEWKVRTYNDSNYISSDGMSKYNWFNFSKTPYGGSYLKGGIIEFHLHDSSYDEVVIGTITFKIQNNIVTMGTLVGNQYIDLVSNGIGYDDFGVYGISTGSAANIWIHWTSKLFYGTY